MSPGLLFLTLGRWVSALGILIHTRSRSRAMEFLACGDVRLKPPPTCSVP